jgi:mannosyltransferase OCH1-like enzyme
MPLHIRYFVKSIKDNNPSAEHRLWTDHNLPILPDNIKQVYDYFGEQKKYAFQADVLRLFLIKEYGGIYLDVDFNHVGPLCDIFEYENFFCSMNGIILNGIFGAKKKSECFKLACEAVDINTKWYGPSWFTKIVSPYIKKEITLRDFEEKYAKHHALASWVNK